MKVVEKFISFVVVVLLIITSFPVAAYADAYNQMVTRFDGKDRYEVAVNISKAEYPNGTSTVVLVNGSYDKLADGLAATPLAKALNAPILLTSKDSIPDVTMNEINRLNATVFYVIGGPGSVSDNIVNDLGATRISGKDRYEVAINVASKLKEILATTRNTTQSTTQGTTDTTQSTTDTTQGTTDSTQANSLNVPFTKAYICNGYTYADALAVAPIAAKEGNPILFVSSTTDNVTNNTKSYIQAQGITAVDAIGGAASITDDVINAFNANRVDGLNRAALSVAIAQKYYQNPNGLFVVNGYCPADALSIGPYAANYNYPIVYVNSDGISVEQSVQDYSSANNLSLISIIVVGGTVSVTNDAISKISLGYTGLKFFDTYITNAQKQKLIATYGSLTNFYKQFKDEGYTGVIRYTSLPQYGLDPDDLTKDEMNAIFQSGLGLMVVQHVRYSGWVPTADLGKKDGQAVVNNMNAIGAPKKFCVWLDLEGVKPGTPKQDIIAYCNAWYDAVANDYVPGIYVGFNSFLTSDDLYYSLKFQHYWRSLSNVPDVSVRGYQMEQSGVAGTVNGINIDLDTVFIDRKGDSIIYWANGSLCSPSPQDIPPSK